MTHSPLYKIVLCLFICSTLSACAIATTTSRIHTFQLIKNVQIVYRPDTGTGTVYVELLRNPELHPTYPVDLGRNDSFVITNGENVYTIDSMPGGEIEIPVVFDIESEISVEFIRSGKTVEQYALKPDTNLKPSIHTKATKLTKYSEPISVNMGFGFAAPYKVGFAQRFGVTMVTDECVDPQSIVTKIDTDKYFHDRLFDRDRKVGGKILPIDFSYARSYGARDLIPNEATKLKDGEFQRCDVSIYSFVNLQAGYPGFSNGRMPVSHQVGRDLSVVVMLLSEPKVVSVHRSVFDFNL